MTAAALLALTFFGLAVAPCLVGLYIRSSFNNVSRHQTTEPHSATHR